MCEHCEAAKGEVEELYRTMGAMADVLFLNQLCGLVDKLVVLMDSYGL